ncbi:HET-domain-containing protein [Xylaria sp. FL0933]|nr:HET-domain-containing protein [Xylaria sp. FL0933]
MSLCSACLHVLGLNVGVGPERPVPHHASMTDYLEAVRKRCPLCWRGYRLLRPAAISRLRVLEDEEARSSIGSTARAVDNTTKHGTRIFRMDTLYGLSFSLQLEGIPATSSIAWNALFLIPADDLMRFPQQHDLPANTGSMAALATVSRWLNRCVSNHSKCRIPNESNAFRPKRLVDIGKHPSLFFVISGDQAPSIESYITLSYKWGLVNDILLTTATEDQLRSGRAIEDLPQTFQETFSVARYIGIRFVWIDCLCIIQKGDGGKDWASECSRMSEIYRHAYCNIAANYGSEIKGLFFERNPCFYNQAKIQIPDDSGQGTADWVSVDRYLWPMEVNNSPLNNRGWVFQERMLAPRVIHFCSQEIFWECREDFLCESFPDVLPPSELFHLGKTIPLRQSPSEIWPGSNWEGDENFPVNDLAYEVWDDIVKPYTACQFTHPSDKLVAISGIARHMKVYVKDTYIAGMWLKRLSAELAWWVYRDRDRHVLGEEPSYYAPSFSWASVKGQINSAGPFAIGILVQVECVTLTSGNQGLETDKPFTDDVFGILLESPPFQLKVAGNLRSARLYKLEEWKLSVPNSVRDVNKGGGGSSMHKDNDRVELRPRLDFQVPDSETENFAEAEFYMIYWRHGPQPGHYDMTGAHLHCMLLSVLDAVRGQFRRIGWVLARDPDDINLMLRDGVEEGLPGRFNEEQGLYTIYLV